jgi:hypothetical protein
MAVQCQTKGWTQIEHLALYFMVCSVVCRDIGTDRSDTTHLHAGALLEPTTAAVAILPAEIRSTCILSSVTC